MKTIWWASLTALLVIGCGSKEDEKEDEEANPLIGTWKSSCTLDDDQYQTGTYEFSAFEVTVTQNMFSDAACTTATMSLVLRGTHVTGSEATSTTTVEGATPIDITVITSKFTVHDETTLTEINSVQGEEGCSEALVLDTATNTSNCAGLFGTDGPPVEKDVLKSVYSVTDDVLILGSEATTDSNGRDASLDSTAPFAKQPAT